MENGGGSANGGGLPEIELIIKASQIDGKRKGADIFCQERSLNRQSVIGCHHAEPSLFCSSSVKFQVLLFIPLS